MFLYAVRYQSWFLPKIMSSLLCRKSTKTYGKTDDTIIVHHISARDIVSHSNCRFGKRRQKICLIGPRYLKLFSNARIKLKIPDEGLSRFFNNSL